MPGLWPQRPLLLPGKGWAQDLGRVSAGVGVSLLSCQGGPQGLEGSAVWVKAPGGHLGSVCSPHRCPAWAGQCGGSEEG